MTATIQPHLPLPGAATMGNSITLKDLPEALYQHLRAAAAANNRSIEAEVIARLEAAVPPAVIDMEAHIARADAIAAQLEGKVFEVEDIERAINWGRP